MAPTKAIRFLTSAVVIGSFVALLCGCASAARVDVQPIGGSASAPNVHELEPALDGFLRTLGYQRESESSSKAVRDHGAYWKSLPSSGGESLFEIWYKVTGAAKIEVRLFANPRGIAVAVFTDEPMRESAVNTDAREVPGHEISWL